MSSLINRRIIKEDLEMLAMLIGVFILVSIGMQEYDLKRIVLLIILMAIELVVSYKMRSDEIDDDFTCLDIGIRTIITGLTVIAILWFANMSFIGKFNPYIVLITVIAIISMVLVFVGRFPYDPLTRVICLFLMILALTAYVINMKMTFLGLFMTTIITWNLFIFTIYMNYDKVSVAFRRVHEKELSVSEDTSRKIELAVFCVMAVMLVSMIIFLYYIGSDVNYSGFFPDYSSVELTTANLASLIALIISEGIWVKWAWGLYEIDSERKIKLIFLLNLMCAVIWTFIPLIDVDENILYDIFNVFANVFTLCAMLFFVVFMVDARHTVGAIIFTLFFNILFYTGMGLGMESVMISGELVIYVFYIILDFTINRRYFGEGVKA